MHLYTWPATAPYADSYEKHVAPSECFLSPDGTTGSRNTASCVRMICEAPRQG